MEVLQLWDNFGRPAPALSLHTAPGLLSWLTVSLLGDGRIRQVLVMSFRQDLGKYFVCRGEMKGVIFFILAEKDEDGSCRDVSISCSDSLPSF
jgi:hypothetical protein